MCARSAAVSCCPATARAPTQTARRTSCMRDGIALIYLFIFIAPQVVLYVYLRDRLPDPARPRQALWVRRILIALFAFFNFPWVFMARRVLFGSVWSKGWIPYIGPWVAWQMLAWIFLGLVAVYVIFKGLVLCVGKG